MKTILALILVTALSGCHQWEYPAGHSLFDQTEVTTTKYRDDGKPDTVTTNRATHTEMQNDADPKGPLAGTQGPSGVTLNTGGSWGIDQVLKQLDIVVVLGCILILAGVVSFIARFWFPIVPITASVYMVIAGVGMLFLPKLIDGTPIWLIIGIIVTGAVLWAVGAFSNFGKEKAKKKAVVKAAATGKIPPDVIPAPDDSLGLPAGGAK